MMLLELRLPRIGFDCDHGGNGNGDGDGVGGNGGKTLELFAFPRLSPCVFSGCRVWVIVKTI